MGYDSFFDWSKNMKKFNVNIGNFNIYGQILPIGSFYGKIGDVLYYTCETTRKDILERPKVNGVRPIWLYVWRGEINGFILELHYDKLAQIIFDHAEKNNAWNNGVKKDVCYGMGKTLNEKTEFISDVTRKFKGHSMKDGAKYHASQRNKNKGEIPLNCGECIIARTFNTGRSIPYKE